MPNTLVIVSRFHNGKFEVEATVKEGSQIPKDIFIYERTPEGRLGDYVGITFVPDMARLSVWDPKQTSNFGSRFTRFHTGLAKLDSSKDQTAMIDHMRDTFARLVDQYQAGSAEIVEEYVV